MSHLTKVKLSSNVLEMKFMKKSKEKSEKEAEENEREFLYNELPDVIIKEKNSMIIMEPSFVPILGLLPGRFSFRGMNPEIEKLMEEHQRKSVSKKMDGVTDKEMAHRYSTLIGTMSRKFNSKRKRVAENRASEDDDDDNQETCSTPNTSLNSGSQRKFRKPKD